MRRSCGIPRYRATSSARPVSVGPAFALPGLWFNQSELYALLTMQQLLAGPRARGLLARMSRRVCPPHDAARGSRHRARRCGETNSDPEAGRAPTPAGIFEITANATLRRRRLRIQYTARGTSEISIASCRRNGSCIIGTTGTSTHGVTGAMICESFRSTRSASAELLADKAKAIVAERCNAGSAGG